MANALHNSAVPAAGLEILQNHTGGFNSENPGFPYKVRSMIESSIAEESKQEQSHIKCGGRIAKAIQRLFEDWRMTSEGVPPPTGKWSGTIPSGAVELTVTQPVTIPAGVKGVTILQPSIKISHGSSLLSVTELAPLTRLYYASDSSNVHILLLLENPIQAVMFHGFSSHNEIEWIDLHRIQTADMSFSSND